MKKILTAIGNTKLNDRLLQKEKYNVIAKDIQYKEGILEVLSIDSQIDTLIVSEILEGEIDFKELINKIIELNENIEIIVFLDKEDIELKSFLFSKGISKIYINNQIDIDTFIINLEDNTDHKTNELNEEIRKLKEIIKNKEESKKEIKRKGKIIAITGAYGAGKSMISCVLCKEFAKLKKKTLIIDFDVFNSSINVIYNVFKYKTDCNSFIMKENIIEVSKYEHLLCATDLIFSDENAANYINLEKMLEEFKDMYDQIIIDTTSNFHYKYLSRILNIADDIVFIVVPNISEIKKAKMIYETFVEDFKIALEKFKLVINKENNYSVDSLIIAQIFNINKVSGKLKYREDIEVNINNKMKKYINIGGVL